MGKGIEEEFKKEKQTISKETNKGSILMENLEYKDKYKDEDYINGLYHIMQCIDQKGVDKCSKNTRVAYDMLKDLTNKLSTTHVLYRP